MSAEVHEALSQASRLLGCAGAGSVEAYRPVATEGHIGSSSHVPSSSRLVEEEEEEKEEKEATHE